MDKISTCNQTVDRAKFDANFDRIFGTGKKTKGSYIQDPETGKLVPANEYIRPAKQSTYVHGDMAPVKSPITGEVFTCRGKLEKHNREHGITNSADYSPQFLENRKKARIAEGDRQAKRSRIDDIQRAIYQHTKR